ncbi:MAG: hypothetical protein L0271_09175 [Gemmatimonadetes bacterium]|nr:hypothetical protein [Gemmatimonadota bacterium]
MDEILDITLFVAETLEKLGIPVKVGGDRLDLSYLRHIAGLLAVENLLRRACEEADIDLPPS